MKFNRSCTILRRELKRYWKNMYGYRLTKDDTEEPEFYVNVVFGGNYTTFDSSQNNNNSVSSRHIFCYPHWCVRGFQPFPHQRVDPEPIVEQFMQDIAGKESMPLVNRLVENE